MPAIDSASTKPAAAIGVDGCPAGWVWIGRIEGRWQAGIAEHLDDLAALLDGAVPALIDMPIGLVNSGPDERACDVAARALLRRPRASSVFRPPCRAALAAADYAGACAVNRRHTGVALSVQTWNILPKIRQLDNLLQRRPALRGRLREAHPEVCLHALAGGRGMAHNKRTADGRRERRELLRRLAPDALEAADGLLAATPRRRLAADDAIDAAALAVTAALLATRPVRTLPAVPARDALGLPMEMVYVTP